MKLIIVESPHKATTISKYLGSGYKVIASKGHVRDLPEKSTGVDVKNNYKPEYVISPAKEATIKYIKQEAAKADKVYLAGDPDREGEAISWHISEVCNISGNDIRIEFNEISKKAVEKALTMPRAIDMNLVDAYQARRVLDRLVGYELSPVVSKAIQSGLSAGRVQSVTLKLIVDRENEIKNFKPEEYWNISAYISKTKDSKSYKCDLEKLNGKKVKVNNSTDAQSIIDNSKAGDWSIGNVKRSQSKAHAPAPFTTSSMQQEAISKLGFTAAMVTSCAQKLYEGADVQGEGQIALVTYIRTDSVRVSPEAQRACLDFIKNNENYGPDYVPNTPNFYATKGDAQDAHEAIRPIDMNRTPDSLKDKMKKEEWRLYNLIYKRFLASQMASAVYDTLDVQVLSKNNADTYEYKLKGKTCVFKGFTAAYSVSDEKDETKSLPNFTEQENVFVQDVKGEQKFTKPEPRYTDGTIIKTMEDNGIGRPSTYSSTVTVLLNRKYVEFVKNTENKKKELVPTELGCQVVEYLNKNFPDIMNVKFTAEMETNLDKIAEGKEKWQKVIDEFYPEFHKKIIGPHVKNEPKESNVICKVCGAKMLIRNGKNGPFLGCSRFPVCKHTEPIEEPVAKCPVCGKDVCKRIGKSGKPYYTCTGYPACKFISWDIPAPILCPKCNSPMRIFTAKDGTKKYICQDRNCKTVVNAIEDNQDSSNDNE